MKKLLVLCLVAHAAACLAWNDAGHRAVGSIAYSKLTTNAKVRLDALLASLPNPMTPKDSFFPPDPFGDSLTRRIRNTLRTRGGTLEDAAVWPDEIRDNEWLHRGNWHYINLPIERDGVHAPGIGGRGVKAVPALVRIASDTSKKNSTRAAAVAWIAHIVGDLHQPLHAVALFDAKHREGDQGGNLFLLDSRGRPLEQKKNLHSYWDNIAGRSVSTVPSILNRISRLVEFPMPLLNMNALDAEVMGWAKESFELANDVVYRTAGPDSPLLSSSAALWTRTEPGYWGRARDVADMRIQQAGVRLAAILNELFG